MTLDQPPQEAHVIGVIVQAGDVAEALAAVLLEILAVLPADLLDRLETVGGEGRAADVDRGEALRRQRLHRLVAIGAQPLLAAHARLEHDPDLLGADAERFGQQPRGLVAEAVVGVAVGQVALGYAVIGGDQELAPSVRLPTLAHARGERLDKAHLVAELVDEARLRNPARSLQARGDRIENRGRRRARVLRVHRQHDQAAHPSRFELADRPVDRGRAVAHAEGDGDPLPETAPELGAQRLFLAARNAQERRALLL